MQSAGVLFPQDQLGSMADRNMVSTTLVVIYHGLCICSW